MNTNMTTSPDGPAWYFGYGANMAASVFIERRKIRPLRTEVAYMPSHALCFNVLGIPYVDPGNGGIRPLCPETTDPTACVHGVAYLLTPDDLKKVVLSEGCVRAFHARGTVPVVAPPTRQGDYME
ncbi:Glik, partial [Metarhizium majus ARSEF 297]